MHWSARSSVDCAGRSPSALWTRRRRSLGWPSGSSSWGCLVRLRCASAGCLLLRCSLSASSALSSSFVTILSLISTRPGSLQQRYVKLRGPPRSAVSDHPVGVLGLIYLYASKIRLSRKIYPTKSSLCFSSRETS